MDQTEGDGLGGPVEFLLFLKILGDLVLVTGRAQGAELVDVPTKRVTRVIRDGNANCFLAIPTDGESDALLIGGLDGTIRQYDPHSGSLRRKQEIGDGAIRDLGAARHGDELLVAVASQQGVRVWRTGGKETTAVRFTPRPHGARPFRICFAGHGDDQYLVCAFTDGWIAAWHVDALERDPQWRQGHAGTIWTLISLDDGLPGARVATGSADQTMCVWRVARDDIDLLQNYQTSGTIRRLGFVVEGDADSIPMLASASATGSVTLWRYDGPTDRPLLEAARHRGECYAIACADTVDGIVVASGDFNGDVEINHLSSTVLKGVRTFFRTDGAISALTGGTGPNGPFVACAGTSGQVRVVDPNSGAVIRTLGHGRAVRALATRGRHLISSGLDHRVLDWDIETGQLISDLPMGHDAEVHALAIVDHGGVGYVVSGGNDGTVQRCVLDDPESATELASGCGQVTALAVIPATAGAAAVVVIASSQGLFRVPINAPGEVATIAPHSVHAACVVHDGPSPRIVAARPDGSVDMYDPVKLTQIAAYDAPFPPRPVRVLASHLSERGDTLLLGGCDDGYLLKWRVDGRLVGAPSRSGRAALRALHVGENSAGTADGTPQPVLLTAGDDASVREWKISPDQPLVSGGSFGNPTRVSSLLLQDQPSDADLLSREALIGTIVEALTSAGTEPPVVIGVHAPWGQGKSSVLKQIRARLEGGAGAGTAPDGEPAYELREGTENKRVDDGPIKPGWAWERLRQRIQDGRLPYTMVPVDGQRHAITVWFNPWMYERPDQVWAGLTQELTEAITSKLPAGQRRRLFFDLNLKRTGPEAMRRQIMTSMRPRTNRGLALAAAAVLLCAVTLIGAVSALVNTNKFGAIVGAGASTFLIALAVTGRIVFTAAKGFPTWFDPAAVARSSPAGALPREHGPEADDPLESGERGYLYLLQHDVKELIDLATGHADVYIFVDDLDRCSPAVVADTIEAVNLFLTKAFGPCSFILALDPATVAAHLETAHPSLNERAKEDQVSFGHLRHTGWRFMEKIVDLPIRLPRIPDAAISNYLNELLNAGGWEAATEATAVPETTRQASGPGIPNQNRVAAASVRVAATTSPPRPDAVKSVATTPAVTPRSEPPVPNDLGVVNPLGRMEDVPLVRDALTRAVLNLPGRNPRQTKAFINLWRFYMVLDYELGYMTNSITATRVHCAEMARLVEIMVRWPWLLDALGARRPVGSDDPTMLAALANAAGDEEAWQLAAKSARMESDDEATQGLRELLRRRESDSETLIRIATRYL